MGQHVELLANVRANTVDTALYISNIPQDYQDLMVFFAFKLSPTVASSATATPLYVTYDLWNNNQSAIQVTEQAVQQIEYPITQNLLSQRVLAADQTSAWGSSYGYMHIRNYSQNNGTDLFSYETYSTLSDFGANTGDDSKPTTLATGSVTQPGQGGVHYIVFTATSGYFDSSTQVANRVTVYGIKNRFI